MAGVVTAAVLALDLSEVALVIAPLLLSLAAAAIALRQHHRRPTEEGGDVDGIASSHEEDPGGPAPPDAVDPSEDHESDSPGDDPSISRAETWNRAARLSADVDPFTPRGRLDVREIDRLLDSIRQDPADNADAAILRANLLNHKGFALERAGLFADALVVHEEAARLFERRLDDIGRADSFGNMGVVRGRLGDYPEAQKLHESGRKVRRSEDRLGLIATLNNLAVLYIHNGDTETAGNALDEARQVGDSLPDTPAKRRAVSKVLNNIGVMAAREQRWPHATALFTQAADLRGKGLDAHRAVAKTLNNLAVAMLHDGQQWEAVGVFKDAAALFGDVDDPIGMANTYGNAVVAAMMADPDNADRDLRTRFEAAVTEIPASEFRRFRDAEIVVIDRETISAMADRDREWTPVKPVLLLSSASATPVPLGQAEKRLEELAR